MPLPRRRAVLAAPALLISLPARAVPPAPPPFDAWVGRTARLRSDDGAARLLLEPDGTGMLAVRFMFMCRSVVLTGWAMSEDAHRLRYRRPAVLDPSRVVEGEAMIDEAAGLLLWREARDRICAFDGFEAPEAARACG